MAEKLPFMPFYGTDFYEAEENALLSLSDEAVLIRLLYRQWRSGSLPESVEALEKLVGAPVSAAVLAQFPVMEVEGPAEPRRMNRWMAQERSEWERTSLLLAEAGRRGAENRWAAETKRREKRRTRQLEAEGQFTLGDGEATGEATGPANGEATGSANGRAYGTPFSGSSPLLPPSSPEPLSPPYIPPSPGLEANASRANSSSADAQKPTVVTNWPARFAEIYESVGMVSPAHLGRALLAVVRRYGVTVAEAMWGDYTRNRPHLRGGQIDPDYENFIGMGPDDFRKTVGFWFKRQQPITERANR